MIALRYLRLRGRMAANFLRTGSVPAWIVAAALLGGVATAAKFSDAASLGLTELYESSPQRTAQVLALTLVGLQTFLLLVVAGAVAMRLFETRRLAAADPLDTLPISRAGRFVIDLAESSFAPVAFVVLLLWPSGVLFSIRAGLPVGTGLMLALHFAIVAAQVVFLVLLVMTGALLFAPSGLLQKRGMLFVAFIMLFAPALPLMRSLAPAVSQAQVPGWLPQAWSAQAVLAVARGEISTALVLTAMQLALLAVLGLAAWLVYGRMFYGRREEILAKLTQRHHATTGRRSLLGRILPRDIEALLTKELAAFDRDPNLRVIGTGLGAFILVFLLLSVLFGLDLAILPIAGAGFLAVYLVASLGLSTFSFEGDGLPILATLPVRPGRLLVAKTLANALSLSAVAGLSGAAVGFASPHFRIPGMVLCSVLAICGAIPLAIVVTLLAAIFSGKGSFGRRVISPWAMGFMMALSSGSVLSLLLVGVAAAYFGASYFLSGLLVLGMVGAATLLGLIRTAHIDVSRALTGRVESR